MSPVSDLYMPSESDEVVLYRARVRALFVIEPDITAADIDQRFIKLFGPFGVPENWLELAAEEKQKIHAAKFTAYNDAMSAGRTGVFIAKEKV